MYACSHLLTICAVSTHLSCKMEPSFIQYLLPRLLCSGGLMERENGSPGGREEITFIGSLPCGGFPLSATYAPLPAMWAPLPVTCAPLSATCDPLPAMWVPLPVTCAPLLATCTPLLAMCAPLPVTCAPPLVTWTRPDSTVSRVFLFHED